VVGLTTDQAARMLDKKYRKYLVSPSISVGLFQKHVQQVIVGGFVAKPGPVPYLPNLHVLDVIAECGDVLPNGNEQAVTVTHPDKTSVTLDLYHPERKAHSDVNILVGDGDIVFVPEQRGEFTVTGEVTKPGSYLFKPEMTVMDAMTAASSYLPDADLQDATLTRDLNSLMRQGDMSQNLPLQAGDKITVPIGNRVYVYGAVIKPGFYTLLPGDRFLDALNAAGGPIQGPDFHADLNKITLIRNAPNGNHEDIYHVDLQAFLKKGDPIGNPLLQPKDVIWIGDKHTNQAWATVAYGLSNALGFVNTGASVLEHGLGH
jgi:protein involved in polysaccharide export with SLBB domain